MELTSTLICPKCALASLTEETCSHCGMHLPSTPLPTPTEEICSHCGMRLPSTPLPTPTDGPTSSDLISRASLDVHSSPNAQADSGQVHLNGQDIPPSLPATLKTSDSSSTSIYHLVFWGRGQTLFGIFIVNTLYTLLTLGLYSFWGRVRIRQFLSSQTSLTKIRFSYHGTGMELLKGWSKALVVFGIPYAFLSLVPIIWEQVPAWIPEVLAALMMSCFIPIAVVGSQRYRLSRTAFGAIRFSFRGYIKDYLKIWFIGTFLTFLTAGVYYPFFENARREFLVSHTYLGNRHFTYNGTGMALLRIYGKALGLIVCTLLATTFLLIVSSGIPLTADFQEQFTAWLQEPNPNLWFSIGILVNVGVFIWSWFYLQLSKQRYFWNHSTFGNASFQFTASTWNLIELRVTNFFMLVLTFSLAWSWVRIRNLQFLYYYLRIQGPLDIHQIEQEAVDASPTGEELSGYFDAGFDLG